MRDSQSHRIRSISIVGGFLDGLRFDFAERLNCLIGGRGTGKTTVIELVRYALDELPDDSDPAKRRRIESLVAANLKDGRIQVEIETKDGLHYIVSRIAGDEPRVLTPDQKPTGITLRSGGVFKANLYSQNEIEVLADQAVSQLSIIDNFAREEINEIDSQVRKLKSALNANASHINPLKEQRDSLAEEVATLQSVEDKLKGLSAGDSGSSKAIERAHEEKALRESQRGALES